MPEPQLPKVGEDVTHLMGAISSPESTGSAGSRFAEGAWKNLNPMGLVTAAEHPIDTLGALIDAQIAQFTKAKDAYDKGRYSEAVGHLGAGVLPVLGPPAANAGERIGSGDVAGGLGEATGLLASVEAPRALKATTGAVMSRVAPVVSRVAPLATELAPDAVGLVSPRMAHGLKLLNKISEKLSEAEPASAETTAPNGVKAPPPVLDPDAQAIRDQTATPPKAPYAKRAAGAQRAAAPAEPAPAARKVAEPPKPDPNPMIQKVQKLVDALKTEGGLTEAEADQAFRWIAQGVEPKLAWQRIQDARALLAKRNFQKLPTAAEVQASVADRNTSGRWPEGQ